MKVTGDPKGWKHARWDSAAGHTGVPLPTWRAAPGLRAPRLRLVRPPHSTPSERGVETSLGRILAALTTVK